MFNSREEQGTKKHFKGSGVGERDAPGWAARPKEGRKDSKTETSLQTRACTEQSSLETPGEASGTGSPRRRGTNMYPILHPTQLCVVPASQTVPPGSAEHRPWGPAIQNQFDKVKTGKTVISWGTPGLRSLGLD